jgi:uncharacterized protein (UPF0248 family)
VIPIHALLARIRHDPAFGRGRWEVAYLDRARMGLARVPLDEIHESPGVRFMFEVVDEEGVRHAIPYHRVREVWRDGKRVWSRLAPRPPAREKSARRRPKARSGRELPRPRAR